MSAETVPAPAPAAAPPQEAQAPEDTPQAVQETTEDAAEEITAGVEAVQITPQSELHRACAEGRLDDVRATLGRGLDALETLDLATGCTPIVLAIQNGHVDVVRELLSAGAIVPPPGLTMDPVMLSILYPQPMYGVPPPFAQMPPQFYHQPGFMPFRGKDSPNGAVNGAANGAANLPPAEVAKTIPCRNFPACKYGASCMFFHPRPQPGFYPGPGYYEGFVPYPSQFYPGEFQAAEGDESVPPTPATAVDTSNTQHETLAPGPASAPPTSAPHVPSPIAPAFVPGAIPIPEGMPNGAPFSPGYMGPMSPSILPTPPPMPSDPAFFATSPNQFGFVPNGYPGPRRQSFGQFSGPPKPFHGKKPSFSGGPKPWPRPGGSSHLGQWKDGNPPPCAFFREGKCRNREFCKFPHIDENGNDVRHPDVVQGLIAPLPTRPRPMRMMGGYDPRYAMMQKANGEAEEADKEASLPPKPAGTATAVPPVARSHSGPGGARLANGSGSRAHSPNRRGPRYNAGSRSSSASGDKKTAPQRVPRADEFPALAVGPGSITPSSERREPSWGKTAAQVLSEPAPSKPASPKAESEDEKEPKETKDEEPKEAKETTVTMDSDSEQDAVIVSVSTTPNPETAKAKSAVSFASVAGTASPSPTSALDAAPVALKA